MRVCNIRGGEAQKKLSPPTSVVRRRDESYCPAVPPYLICLAAELHTAHQQIRFSRTIPILPGRRFMSSSGRASTTPDSLFLPLRNIITFPDQRIGLQKGEILIYNIRFHMPRQISYLSS